MKQRLLHTVPAKRNIQVPFILFLFPIMTSIKNANIQSTLVKYSKSFADNKRRRYNILRKFLKKNSHCIRIHIITHDIPMIDKAVSSRTASNLCHQQKHSDKKQHTTTTNCNVLILQAILWYCIWSSEIFLEK